MLFNFFKNTKKETTLLFSFVKDYNVYTTLINSPDFIICDNVEQTPIYKKIIYDEKCKDAEVTFTESTCKFMLIEFKVDGIIYKIDLLTNEFNYYFVDNKFTKDFFIFYVKNYLDKNFKILDTMIYSLKFIDHNVNVVEILFINNNESILLTTDGYKIILN
jgi:hypothetical protein